MELVKMKTSLGIGLLEELGKNLLKQRKVGESIENMVNRDRLTLRLKRIEFCQDIIIIIEDSLKAKTNFYLC